MAVSSATAPSDSKQQQERKKPDHDIRDPERPAVKPVIALVGRPNVGKSTLFNRLTQTRDAIVADFAGLTRDRHYGNGRQGKHEFIVIDTGGFEPDAGSGIFKE